MLVRNLVMLSCVKAHLWPLQLIASSLWRVVEQQAESASGNHVALGCLGILIIGLLAEILSFWRRGGPAVQETSGDDHE